MNQKNQHYQLSDNYQRNKENISFLINQGQQTSPKKISIPKILLNEKKAPLKAIKVQQYEDIDIQGKIYDQQTKRLKSDKNNVRDLLDMQTLRQNCDIKIKKDVFTSSGDDQQRPRIQEITKILQINNRTDLIKVLNLLWKLPEASQTQQYLMQVDRIMQQFYEKQLQQIIPVLLNLKNNLQRLQSPLSSPYHTPGKSSSVNPNNFTENPPSLSIIQNLKSVICSMNSIKQFTICNDYPLSAGISQEKSEDNCIVNHIEQNQENAKQRSMSLSLDSQEQTADIRKQIKDIYDSFKAVFKLMISLLFQKINKQGKIKSTIGCLAIKLYKEYKLFKIDIETSSINQFWQNILNFFIDCRVAVDEINYHYKKYQNRFCNQEYVHQV